MCVPFSFACSTFEISLCTLIGFVFVHCTRKCSIENIEIEISLVSASILAVELGQWLYYCYTHKIHYTYTENFIAIFFAFLLRTIKWLWTRSLGLELHKSAMKIECELEKNWKKNWKKNWVHNFSSSQRNTNKNIWAQATQTATTASTSVSTSALYQNGNSFFFFFWFTLMRLAIEWENLWYKLNKCNE